MASVKAKHCRIQIGKIDMASHAWPDRNSGKSGIIAYLPILLIQQPILKLRFHKFFNQYDCF